MSVDFSNVKIGDRIKLTRENGDESTFTVHNKGFIWANSVCEGYRDDEWDTLEVLEKPLPTKTGAMLHNGGRGGTYFVRNSVGEWLNDAGHRIADSEIQKHVHEGWKVVFEGLEYDA